MKNDSDNPASDRGFDPLDRLLRSARWPDNASDPLDKLLCMAKWPEPTADSFHWRQQMAQWQSRNLAESIDARPHVKSVPNSRRKNWRTAWAVAGSVAAAVLFTMMTLWIMRPAGDKPSADVPTNVARSRAPDAPVSADARETVSETNGTVGSVTRSLSKGKDSRARSN